MAARRKYKEVKIRVEIAASKAIVQTEGHGRAKPPARRDHPRKYKACGCYTAKLTQAARKPQKPCK
jgi:hypothetical protein